MNLLPYYCTTILAVLALALAIASVSSARAQILVDRNASGANDGSSWASAYETIQSAVDDAASSSEEIWVAAGSYNETITLRSGNRLLGFLQHRA